MAHVLDDPTGLSLRARRFLATRATRQEVFSPHQHREHWRSQGLAEDLVERLAGFHDRWGGLTLPPTRYYEGGPVCLDADLPALVDGLGWCIEAGDPRSSVPFGFYLDGAGSFGVAGERFVALHESLEGWIEACALEDAAAGWDLVARRSGDVRELLTTWVPRVGPLTPVAEVRGVADSWWRGDGVMLWICSGEARLYAAWDDGPEPEAFLYALS